MIDIVFVIVCNKDIRLLYCHCGPSSVQNMPYTIKKFQQNRQRMDLNGTYQMRFGESWLPLSPYLLFICIQNGFYLENRIIIVKVLNACRICEESVQN
jgi:hypothetical protein